MKLETINNDMKAIDNEYMVHSKKVESIVLKYKIGICYAISIYKKLGDSYTSIKSRSDLPNKDGYSFYAVLSDGKIIKDKVNKTDKGLHTTSFFKQTIGWLPLNYN